VCCANATPPPTTVLTEADCVGSVIALLDCDTDSASPLVVAVVVVVTGVGAAVDPGGTSVGAGVGSAGASVSGCCAFVDVVVPAVVVVVVVAVVLVVDFVGHIDPIVCTQTTPFVIVRRETQRVHHLTHALCSIGDARAAAAR
jgi:hypothetical protein